MCICVNCQFYKTCWMKAGLQKMDPYIITYLPKITPDFNNEVLDSFIEVNLMLNLFLMNENYEFDVIECSCFCENSGNWI